MNKYLIMLLLSVAMTAQQKVKSVFQLNDDLRILNLSAKVTAIVDEQAQISGEIKELEALTLDRKRLTSPVYYRIQILSKGTLLSAYFIEEAVESVNLYYYEIGFKECKTFKN